MIKIRPALDQDRDAIRDLYMAAFLEAERADVAALAMSLLDDRATSGILSLVALMSERVAGHIAFSPVAIEGAAGKAFILAPLAVNPQFQHRGVGQRLVHEGLARLSEYGAERVFVYGDPAYYKRFGFSAEAAVAFIPPYSLEYPFGWQALLLARAPVGVNAGRLSVVDQLYDSRLW